MGILQNLARSILRSKDRTYIQNNGYELAFGYTCISLILFFIAYLIIHVLKRQGKPNRAKQIPQIELQYSLDTQFDDNNDLNIAMTQPSSALSNIKSFAFHISPFWNKLLMFIACTLILFSIAIGGLAPAFLSGTDVISITYSIMMLLIYFTMIFFYVVWKLQSQKETDKYSESLLNPTNSSTLKKRISLLIRKYSVLTTIYIIFALLYSFVVPAFLSGLCLAHYNPKAGFEYDAFWASTSMTRYFSQATSSTCPEGKICHIYSTLPEDPSSSMIINVHTGKDIHSIDIFYDTVSNHNNMGKLAYRKSSQSFHLDVEKKVERYVHSVYLNNLQPATDYYIQIMYNGQVQDKAYFSTFPDENSNSNITLVTGGDAGGALMAEQISSYLSGYKPDAIIVGGDVVYDNGNCYCWYTWDLFLDMFSRINKHLNKLVPIVLAVGNHDVGQNHYQFIPIDKERNLFFFYFPQHSKTTEDGELLYEVPDPKEREAYFYHKIEKTLHLTLDSGYLNSYDGKQLEWLDTISQGHSNMAKYATYHVPMVPACFFGSDSYDKRLNLWAPRFEKYRFMAVFENHMHLFKRTFPVKFGNDTDFGVVYFGDGNWGVNPESCFEYDEEPNRTGIFATMGNVNHVWVIRMQGNHIEYSAIGEDGNIIGKVFEQNISDYILNNNDQNYKNVSKPQYLDFCALNLDADAVCNYTLANSTLKLDNQL